MISINSNNKFSVVTIEKWEDYQDKKQQENSKVTTEEQQSNTNKNVKNIYLYLVNKYRRENRKNFSEYIKKVRQLKEDPDYNLLTVEEQQRITGEI